MIAIIGAMDQEMDAIRKRLDQSQTKKIAHAFFHEGKLGNKEVVLLQSGIGKVNAAVSTTLLFQNYEIDYVINIGTAGGIKPSASVLDLVISQKVCYHDVDVTGFQYEIGQVPQMPLYFESDVLLMDKIKSVLDLEQFPYHEGLIVSGDSFINKPKQMETITQSFPTAIAVEMEAAAIAQVCHLFEKPFLILRSLSDIAGKASELSFDAYLDQAANNASRFIEKLIQA